jgi:enediyne biosynthesis protein E4
MQSRFALRAIATGIAAVPSVLIPGIASAQWTAVTDSANPIATLSSVPQGSYAGASWVDVDNDGWVDLYPSGRPIFYNQGDGTFVADSTGFPRTLPSLGNTWADVDNDGRIDLFQSGPAGRLFHNLGGGAFALVTTGAAGDTASNRGFQAAFGDYDDDGLVDLLSAHFQGGFAGMPTSNQLLHNEGGLFFTRDDTTPATVDTSTYIVPSWIDLDDDLDLDLTIGRGPISTLGPDDFYRNRLVEDGTFSLEKITTGALETGLRDGQTHAWIDYDNDGDLDCYITNFSGGQVSRANELWRNDGGTYTPIDSTVAGELVGNSQRSTGCVWADFDNDGWIDCVVANDGLKRNKSYRNNGDGTFTKEINAFTGVNGFHYAAVAADYDRDGDQDLFIAGTAASASGLFRNDNANGNHWLSVRLEGTTSNRSAIGATVRAFATVGGVPRWQRRDVQSTTGSPGMSDLAASFGLGDATVVDSLVITWPSDQVQVLTAVAADQFLGLTEPGGVTAVAGVRTGGAAVVFPNPSREDAWISLSMDRRARLRVDILDVAGRRVDRLVDGPVGEGTHAVRWNGRSAGGEAVAPGVYFVRVHADGVETVRKLVRTR